MLTLAEIARVVNLSPYPRPEKLQADEREEVCEKLLKFLLRERGMIAAFSASYARKRELVRSHMNTRAAHPIPYDILELQDRLFWSENSEKPIMRAEDVPEGKYGTGLWQGDITCMEADGIVNAANRAMLGCFVPGHRCVDNAIHSFAGMQLRDDCAKLMAAQGQEEAEGDAKITRAYNLPSQYVLHTVGPMVGRELTKEDRAMLRSSYTSCLNLAEEMGLKSIAFCCIGTGVFNFPREEAAEIAVGAVVNWKLRRAGREMKVIFNTFEPEDTKLYQNILSMV